MNPREKAKIILASIVQIAGGGFNGKTRLYKAFYLAHLIHFQDYAGALSDYPIIRMPRGPAVDAGDTLLTELSSQGIIHLGQRPNGPYMEDVFTLNRAIDGLNSQELGSISRAVAWIGDKSATELSEWTHEFSNTWEDTPNGYQMNVYADLLSECEYSQMKLRHRQVSGAVDAVFT